MAPHSSILAWKIPWTKEPGSLQSMGLQSQIRLSNFTFFLYFADVSGEKSKIQCCREQYCIGIWNVRSMNQGKLQVIKQEMARVNVNILGISKLKWTGMDEFNSDDCYV